MARNFCYGRSSFFIPTRSRCKDLGTMIDQEKLRERLETLKGEHRDLDDAIHSLAQRAVPDMLQLQRLKKKKLFLRDEIAKVESQLLPDIIA